MGRKTEKTALTEYWKTIVDTMMDGVVVVNNKGSIVSVNKALERITGYEARDLIGKSCTVLDCDSCFITCKVSGRKTRKCELFKTGAVVRHRCRLRRKDGNPVYILKNAAVLRNSAGEVTGGVETLTDITDVVVKEQTIRELKDLLSPHDGIEGIIGRSPKMLDLFAIVRNASMSDASVIIYGESGTGKELVANAIHHLGKRAKGPFVKVSCAALNQSLLESELFGHIKGAFTGADKDRRGRFEAAHKGELFLDEIGDIPLSTQVKLLRVLQEKEIERVGDQTPIPIDVRIIAATHRDLERMSREGSFREDLFYRLNVIPVRVPPLRERPEDIPLLVDHFIRSLRLRTDKQIHGVSEEAMSLLSTHLWPGNVRELINALEYAFVVCHGDLITPHHLPVFAGVRTSSSSGSVISENNSMASQRLIEALKKANGNKQEAARQLGVSRVTLWKHMKKHNIQPEIRFDTN